ncbi:MAG: hypothetical protein J5547_05265, partial [Clostridia bacterium]|nr:hypothetical protein [Clostridia bacterium]
VKMIVSAYHAADARIRYIKHLSTDFKRQKDVTAFYYANKHDDLDWVILPIANFNAYYRATTFEKNYLPALPKNVFIRETLDGLCRFKVVL